MDWKSDLELVIKRTNCETFRTLCADDHPMHEAWRRKVQEIAEPWRPIEYPSIFAMAKNVAVASMQMVAAAASGDPITVPPEVLEERRAVCNACEFFVEKDDRCMKCGCHLSKKLALAPMSCPLKKWVPFTGSRTLA